MKVPPILVGHGQGHVIAVHYLNLAHIETIRREGSRQREEVGVGFPDQRPSGDDYHQQYCYDPSNLRSNHHNSINYNNNITM